MNKWYGYEHINGTLHVKRFFDFKDLIEVKESDFVLMSAGPWECQDREHALEMLKKALK